MSDKNTTPMLISGVSCYEEGGVAYLKLEDVARGLGFIQSQVKNGKEYVSIRWETINRYLDDFGFPNKVGKDDYIPENIFYRLAMKAKNETAEKFQALVADEIIPSIRRTGGYVMPKMTKEMQAIFLLDNRTAQLDQRVTALENNSVIDYGQQQTLKNAVNHRVVTEVLGGKDSPAYEDTHVRGMVYCELNKDLQNWFRVSARNNIPRKRFDEAIEYVNRWKPSTNTAMMIQNVNGQTKMFA